MAFHFKKHYTVEEARELIPQLRLWLDELNRHRQRLTQLDERLQLKDLERGLIDFPAIIGGKEVFLCWEKDENDIEFWHDLETGYAGRERLPEA